MLLFSAILILVVIRNLEGPIAFGTRVGPLLVGVGLILFALPIYGDVAGVEVLVDPSHILRIIAGFLLPTGLYLMKPLGRQHYVGESEEPVDDA